MSDVYYRHVKTAKVSSFEELQREYAAKADVVTFEGLGEYLRSYDKVIREAGFWKLLPKGE